MIFLQAVPNNVVGITSPPATLPNKTYAVQDVEWCIYAMQNGTPVKVGWLPATSDQAGGLHQLARGLDVTYNSQYSTAGFGATGNTSGVTVQYPSMQILWNGAMQPVVGGTWTSGPVSAGVLSFYVSYQWGLIQFSLGAYDGTLNKVELCKVSVTATSATIQAASTNLNWMGKYWCEASPAPVNSNAIPYSDANGNMTW